MIQLQNEILNILLQSKSRRGFSDSPYIMIDFEPQILITTKPLYKCLTVKDEGLWTGYTSSRNKIEYPAVESFKDFSEQLRERGLAEVQLISDSYRRPKIINFITQSQGLYSDNSNESLSHLIDKQINTDSLIHFCPLSDWLRVYTKVPNTVVTGFRIHGDSLLRRVYGGKGGDLNTLDVYTVYDDYGTPEQLSIPITDTIQISTIYKNGSSVVNPVYTPCTVKYNVTSLGIVMEDIGQGSISGFDVYPITNNVYADLLLTEYKLYSDKLTDFKYHVYSKRFSATKFLDTDKTIYTPSEQGTIILSQLLEVMKCTPKR